jgi:hypothetical protein
MKGMLRKLISTLFLVGLVVVVLPLAAAQTTEEFVLPEGPIHVTGAVPLSPQPGPDDMAPGLAVQYGYEKFYTLSGIRDPEEPFSPGPPIAMLDHDTETGSVLTAEYSIMVGAIISGLIQFPESGSYTFRVNSNDGVWVSIGGKEIWHDPEVHYHRMSPDIHFEVAEAGWYELLIDYFQKKGSSALQLFWTPPNGTETVVPAEAFAHLK